MFFKRKKIEVQKNIIFRRTILLETYKEKKGNYSIAFGINNVAIGHYTSSYGSYSFSHGYWIAY
jgi:hypothetical protein